MKQKYLLSLTLNNIKAEVLHGLLSAYLTEHETPDEEFYKTMSEVLGCTIDEFKDAHAFKVDILKEILEDIVEQNNNMRKQLGLDRDNQMQLEIAPKTEENPEDIKL